MERNENRRSSERVKFEHPLKWGEDAPTLHAYSYDLSADGISIYCDKIINTGINIEIELLVEGKPIHLKGEVKWSLQGKLANVYRSGIKLSEYPMTLKKIYNSYLNKT